MSDEKKDVTRRDFLKTTTIAAGTLVGGGVVGGLIGYNAKLPRGPVETQQVTKDTTSSGISEQVANRGLMFFENKHDFDILSEATERIFPEDDLGPGAIGLHVPYFIDNQLASSYGINASDYTLGPHYEGEPTQGYQSHLTRAEIFRQGIKKIEEESQKRFSETFTKITDEQKDEILTAFQQDEIEMKGITAGYFFSLLRSATLEGAYSDPLYNGNHNMEGWRMKGFPGHQMSFLNEIEEEGFKVIEPQSLSSMH